MFKYLVFATLHFANETKTMIFGQMNFEHKISGKIQTAKSTEESNDFNHFPELIIERRDSSIHDDDIREVRLKTNARQKRRRGSEKSNENS